MISHASFGILKDQLFDWNSTLESRQLSLTILTVLACECFQNLQLTTVPERLMQST